MSASNGLARFGILAELTSAGFGHLDAYQDDGLYVRVTRTLRGTSACTAQYKVDIVPVTTMLWVSERNRTRRAVKWWKSRPLRDVLQAAIGKYTSESIDQEQTFTMNGEGELLPGSQKRLTHLT
jgi:hypothetical protein